MIEAGLGETFPITYKSPFSDTTLFPQAKIYNSAGVLQATVNLVANATDTSLYESTSSLTSGGKYSVVITPYTDVGYTTKSDVEGATLESILIRTVAQNQPTVFGGVGITEEDIKLIADLVVKKIKIPPPPPQEKIELPKIDLTPVMKEIQAIPQNKPQEVNLKPLEAKISRLEKGLSALKPDLSPLEGEVGRVQAALTEVKSKIENDRTKESISEITGMMQEMMSMMGKEHTDNARMELTEHMTEMKEIMSQINNGMTNKSDIQTLTRFQEMVMEMHRKHEEMMYKMDELQKKRFENLLKALAQILTQLGFNTQSMLTNALAGMDKKIQSMALGDE